MKDSTMTLSTRNHFLRENVTVLMGHLENLRCEKFPKIAEDKVTVFFKDNPKYDPEKYDELADGIETVHTMLLHGRGDFRTARGATRACLNMVIKEMSHIDHFEKPGFEAAKKLFERRLR